MKRKDISLETRILPRSGLSLSRSTGEASSVVSDTPGDISAYDGRYAFSCSWDWEVQLSETLYAYEQEAEFRRVERRTTALGSENTQLEVEETFLGTCENVYARGRVKMRQAKSGVQTHYDYSATSLYGALYTQTAETRIDGEPVSGKSSREIKFISSDARGNASTRRTEFGEPGIRISKTQLPTATNIAQATTNDGFTVSQIDHAGTQTSFSRQYNTGINAGIVLTTTDGRGNATIVEQNVLGWTTKTTDAAGNVTTTAYNLGHGKPSCVTDALGKTHCYAYDLHGNVVAEFGTGTQPAVFSFDDADNPVSQKLFREEDETLEDDPRSRTDLTADETTWSYHATTGLLLTKTYPDGGRIDYAYDAQNRLASTTWMREVSAGVRLKATRTYAEKTGELISVSYNDGVTPTETHSYNHLGQLTQTVDASGTRVYVYNNYNEIESETHTALGATQTPSYDAFGREIYTTLKRGGTTLALFGQSYDAASGRIASGAYGNAVFAFSYLSGTNLVSEIGVMNGYVMTKKISYEANRDLPTEIAYEKPDASLIAKRNYTYDALGRVSARTQTRGNGTPREDTFGYNPRSELISATLGNVNYAYAFDNIGNRTSSTEAGTQSSYSANALNQYDSISLGEAVSSPLQYDADGNATLIQTPTGTWAITYNGANRPIRFENAATQTVVECVYDSQGRRFEKKVTVAGTITLRERYLYKGYLQIAAFEVSGDEETLNYTLKRIVYWDPTEPTATRPLAVNIVNDGVYFPTVDLTKNVCELVDADGDIVATYDYAPFGAVTAGTPSGTAVPANPLQWSSEVYDSELDLVYYNYRHYSPTLGRFLSRDPIAEQGGRNLYAFVKNSPTSKRDILGRSMLAPGAEVWHPGNPEKPTPTGPDCAKRIIAFRKWVEEESKDLSWIDKLPACPKKLSCKREKRVQSVVFPNGNICITQVEGLFCDSPDPSTWKLSSTLIFHCFSESGHPGGKYELRTVSKDEYNGAGNQCIYDEEGSLVESHPTAGTVDKCSPGTGLLESICKARGHNIIDVQPFKEALSLDRECGGDGAFEQMYYSVRPAK